MSRNIPPMLSKSKLERKGIRIAVGVPLPKSGVGDEEFVGFWDIASKGWNLAPFRGGRTDENRNKMALWMLENKYSHLAMMDADHIHHPDIIELMARWVVQDRSRLVIGTLNFKRDEPYYPCLFEGEVGSLKPMDQWEPGLVETPLVGHGAILISRKVFERVEAPWWAYPYNYAAQGSFPAEDSYFCHVCRENDITMYCDTTVTSPHHGDHWITEATYRMYQHQVKLAQQGAANES